ncbi:2',3'-cyclic-nucleotide 2'-phosphodiesterase/5'-or 3'-nucleotidase, 5'-nucleotidase family [Peptostreptococcaceae bacterium pGA-8]|nr:2',3'-cyclic-nucleotide 2'-phosphodiesterase/5'-or 3'-nucleotidase, 5'-nucleotidase family [Peptostreptococcaceae bacterium pGA-8]
MLKKVLVVLLILIVGLTMLVPTMMSFGEEKEEVKSNPDEISFVFNHDMHSHLERFARLGTIIDEQKKSDPDTYVVDAGDFAMGTPFQTIYKTEAAELRMLGYLGFDVTTLGNHEFDFRSAGLSAMLNRAVDAKKASDEADAKLPEKKKANMKLPQLVISNIDWDKTLKEKKLKTDGEALQAALANYGAQSYTVIEKNGKRVAFFGIFGKESADYAPESGTYFLDPVETARKVVAKIKKEAAPDLIVCLSHSGTNPKDKAKSEDEILAKNVDGIDMIVSGHSHTMYTKPLIVNNTLIASTGEYAQHTGIVRFTRQDGKFKLTNYEIKAVEAAEEKKEVAKEVEKFKKLVDENFFGVEGWKWDQVIARSSTDFTPTANFAMEQGDDALGNMLADSFVYGTKVAEGDKYVPVDVTVLPAGIVRGTFNAGDVTVADAYNSLSLGTGKDGEPGYPLVSIYLTGGELRYLAEVDASVSEMMQPARLFTSGLMYTVNPNRMFLNRVEEIYKVNGDPTVEHAPIPYQAGDIGSDKVDAAIEKAENEKTVEKLDSDKLYRVVGDLYSCQMIGSVGAQSKGLLSITPKDKDGKEIKNFEDHIIYRENGKELKEWYAVTSYVDSFPDDTFPLRYQAPEYRKVVNDSKSIVSFFRNPNKLFLMAIGVIVLVLAILILIIVLIVKLIRRIFLRRRTRNGTDIFGPGGGGIYRGYVKKKGSIFRGSKSKYTSKW